MLVISSNRLPIRVINGNVERSDGGLVRALNPVHGARDSVWIGYPGERRALKPDDWDQLEEIGLCPLHISPAMYSLYYKEACNGMIWPFLHSLPQGEVCTPEAWDALWVVNKMFAENIDEMADEGAVVWIHDFHLALVPRMLREQRKDLAIGFFLHIPFPARAAFNRFPIKYREELINGLLGADLVGFHTSEYAENFKGVIKDAVQEYDEQKGGFRKKDGSLVFTGVFPLGIEAEKLHATSKTQKCNTEFAALRERYNGRRVILGVDRLDYTKGIPHRLRAFGRFLEIHPDWIGRVQLVQIAIPTREDVPEYIRERQIVEELVCDINYRFRISGSDLPIEYHYHSIDDTRLFALYRLMQVGLVTPLIDGLNLVAKEMAAIGQGSVIVLSRYAGAWHELKEHVLTVDPKNTGSMVRAIKYGLEMPCDRRMEMSMGAFRDIESNTNEKWSDTFLSELARTHDMNQ